MPGSSNVRLTHLVSNGTTYSQTCSPRRTISRAKNPSINSPCRWGGWTGHSQYILENTRETQSEKALNWGYFSIFKCPSSCHPPHSSFLNSLCLVISFNFLQYCVYYMYVCIYLFIHMFVFQRTVTWDLCVFAIVFVCTGILCVCVIQCHLL